MENALHVFRSEQFREWQEREEKRDGEKPRWFRTNHVMTEKELAVPRQQCAVHVEQGDAGRWCFR